MKKITITVATLLSITLISFLVTSCEAEEQQDPVLLISVDGLMNKYIDRNDTPNFDRIIGDGVWAEYLEPVFPTLTFPTHHSMSTGLFVENHGIIANSFYALDHEERFSYGPPENQNDESWWGGEPIWITAENQGLTSATFFWPGSEASYSGTQPTRWMDYDGSVPYDVRVDSVANWLDPQGDVAADFATLYFSSVDSEGHSHGPDAPEVDEAMKEVDDRLGQLIDRLEESGLWPDVNVIIVSDHGMAELDDEKVIFLDDYVDLDDVNVLNWGAVAMIQPEDGVNREDIYEPLKENEENYSVYYKEDVPEIFGFSNHVRIPEIVMMPDLPYMVNSRDHFEERGQPAGMHGWDHREPEMRAFFAAQGPAFQTSDEQVEPIRMVDLYEMMSDILNIDPSENDGNLDASDHLRR